MEPNKKAKQDTDGQILSDGSANAFAETENPASETDKDISDEELDEMIGDE